MRKQQLYLSLLLALIALVSVTAATVAWFSIADFTKVYSMGMEVTTGTNLRFDLDAHESFEEYVKTLGFDQIADRIRQEKGYDMRRTPLEPVTTSDVVGFRYEDGELVSSDKGAYLEFTLHFMATQDMIVHLTTANREGQGDGTLVSSSNEDLPKALRISFSTEQGTWIYDPGIAPGSTQRNSIRTFGLGFGREMILSEDNRLFSLKGNVDQPVVVRVWLEGTDPACTDALRKADYSIRLRFEGTDENDQPIDGRRIEGK